MLLPILAAADPPGQTVAALGGYVFWSLAYILIIRRGFRDRSFGIPIVALCANVSWEILASFFLGYPRGPMIGNMIWLGFDIVILYTCLKFGAGEFTHPDVKKWFRPLVLIGLVMMFWAEATFCFNFDDPLGINISWINTFVVSAQMVAMYWRRDSLKGQSFWIGVCILLGDISGYLMICYASIKYPGRIQMDLMNALAVGILGANLLYVVLIYRRCVREGLNPWAPFGAGRVAPGLREEPAGGMKNSFLKNVPAWLRWFSFECRTQRFAARCFTRLLRLEAAVCLVTAVAALVIPGTFIRLLAQAPHGSLVGWLDVVVLVRAAGWAHLVLCVGFVAVSCIPHPPVMFHHAAAAMRLLTFAVRWGILSGLPPELALLKWFELALAVATVVALFLALRPRKFIEESSGASLPKLPSRWVLIGIPLGVILLVSGLFVYRHFIRSPGPEVFATAEEHFKYGRLTNQRIPGLPLYIFEALPQVFPEKVPGTNGWQAFGLIQEPGRAAPVGWSVRTNGFPHVMPNCALCHTATYRAAAGEAPRLIVGGEALQLDFQAVFEFLFACAQDRRFTDGTLLKAIKERHRLDACETALYKKLFLPATAKALQFAARDFAWMGRQPAAGPGRFDAGGMLRFNILRLPYDGAVSTTDMLPVWDRRSEAGMWQRWTGGGTNVLEEMRLSAGSLAMLVPFIFDEAGFKRYAAFLESLPPPRFPVPSDPGLAARGKMLFATHCAGCHAPGGATYGRVTSQRDVGTDPEVLRAYDAATVAALHAVEAPPFCYPAQQQTDGYKNVSLSGIWARGPYLHNGSVPTLRDLLEPPSNRPVTFLRGGDLLDPQRVGFVRDAASPGRAFLFDTRLRGNSNDGHRYGTILSDTDKGALVEFLKTL